MKASQSEGGQVQVGSGFTAKEFSGGPAGANFTAVVLLGSWVCLRNIAVSHAHLCTLLSSLCPLSMGYNVKKIEQHCFCWAVSRLPNSSLPESLSKFLLDSVTPLTPCRQGNVYVCARVHHRGFLSLSLLCVWCSFHCSKPNHLYRTTGMWLPPHLHPLTQP